MVRVTIKEQLRDDIDKLSGRLDYIEKLLPEKSVARISDMDALQKRIEELERLVNKLVLVMALVNKIN